MSAMPWMPPSQPKLTMRPPLRVMAASARSPCLKTLLAVVAGPRSAFCSSGSFEREWRSGQPATSTMGKPGACGHIERMLIWSEGTIAPISSMNSLALLPLGTDTFALPLSASPPSTALRLGHHSSAPGSFVGSIWIVSSGDRGAATSVSTNPGRRVRTIVSSCSLLGSISSRKTPSGRLSSLGIRRVKFCSLISYPIRFLQANLKAFLPNCEKPSRMLTVLGGGATPLMRPEPPLSSLRSRSDAPISSPTCALSRPSSAPATTCESTGASCLAATSPLE
mmetsp:Transcript_40589/g.135248  ORF Transcript_40589/g.135248 Transcript_40589/m.135248 type:complete len:280 (+) Transcript_40589:2132-2971(+)